MVPERARLELPLTAIVVGNDIGPLEKSMYGWSELRAAGIARVLRCLRVDGRSALAELHRSPVRGPSPWTAARFPISPIAREAVVRIRNATSY
jgi:hypothetical protein